MLTHPTIEQLRALKLDGMAEAFIELQAQDTARDLAHAEWLALLLDREAASRGTRRYRTRLRAAKLRRKITSHFANPTLTAPVGHAFLCISAARLDCFRARRHVALAPHLGG